MLFDFAKGEYPPFADILFYTLIARNDRIVGKSDLAQKLVRGLWQGLRYMKSNPGTTRGKRYDHSSLKFQRPSSIWPGRCLSRLSATIRGSKRTAC